MSCQEVMELMQRDLDRDLDAKEVQALREHMQNCPECKAMYERLQALSQELEQLPKVTPPSSLVDAIMPQLDAIDRSARVRQEQGLPTVAHMDERRSLQGERSRRRFPLSVAGGVVAAGLVLGIFILNNGVMQDQVAEESAANQLNSAASGLTSESANRSDISNGEAANKSAPMNGQNIMKKNQAGNSSEPGSGETPNVYGFEPKSDGFAPEPSVSAPRVAEPGELPPADNDSTRQSAVPNPGDVREPVSTGDAAHRQFAASPQDAESADQDKAGDAAVRGFAAPDAAQEPETTGSPDQPDVSAQDQYGDGDGLRAPESSPQPSDEESFMDSRESGTANLMAVPTSVEVVSLSPSEIYVAAVIDGKVTVKKSDGEVVFTSERTWQLSDRIELRWNGDDELHYDVVGDETTIRFLIDIKNKQESEVGE